MKEESLTKQTLILSLGRSLSLATNVCVPLILVRLLSPHDYGIYKFFILFLSTIGILASMGMAQSLFYFIPKYPLEKQAYITQSFMFMTWIGLLIIIVGGILSPIVSPLFKTPQNQLVYFILLVSIFGFVINQPMIPVLISDSKVGFASVLIAVMDFLAAVSIITGILIGGTLIHLFIAFSMFQLGRMLFALWYIHTEYRFNIYLPRKQTWRSQLRYAIPFGSANILSYLQGSLHQFIIALFFSPAIFAVYSVASFQLPIVRIWYGSVADIILVRMSDLLRKSDFNGVISVWLNSIRKLGMVFIPLIIYLFLYSEVFITTLFTAQYHESIPIFRIFLFGMIFFCVNCHSVLRASNQTNFIFKINIFTLAFNVVSLYFLTKYWGVIGAAVCTVLTSLFANSFMLKRIAATLNKSVLALLPLMAITRIVISSILAGTVTLPVKYLVEATGFWQGLLILAISFAIFSVAYSLSAWKMGILDPDEKNQIRSMIRRLALLVLRRTPLKAKSQQWSR